MINKGKVGNVCWWNKSACPAYSSANVIPWNSEGERTVDCPFGWALIDQDSPTLSLGKVKLNSVCNFFPPQIFSCRTGFKKIGCMMSAPLWFF